MQTAVGNNQVGDKVSDLHGTSLMCGLEIFYLLSYHGVGE
jgi:hypothetical protein